MANATLDEIEVVLDETTLVREVNKREKHLEVGFSPVEANANIKVLCTFNNVFLLIMVSSYELKKITVGITLCVYLI